MFFGERSAGACYLASLLVLGIIFFGILNIYSIELGRESFKIQSFVSSYAVKQISWVVVALVLCAIVSQINSKLIIFLIPFFYFGAIFLLLLTKLLGKSIYGHNSCISLGAISIQPAEFAKTSTIMMIARIFSQKDSSSKSLYRDWQGAIAVAIPAFIVALQGDIGSCLVFSSFALVFLRENYFIKTILFGLYILFLVISSLFVSHVYIVLAIVSITVLFLSKYIRNPKKIVYTLLSSFFTSAVCYGVNFFVYKILKPHQRDRIIAWVNPENDSLGIGWNIIQSKIAIGSGGVYGKGFLQGTQTKYGFVPEQHTDFIFCTVGEEYGFVGSAIFIFSFCFLIALLFNISENANSRFYRIYGYGVASVLLFHFVINVGMTIGLFPIIGIPLPFMSYGGSSLVNFILMVFLIIKFHVSDHQR